MSVQIQALNAQLGARLRHTVTPRLMPSPVGPGAASNGNSQTPPPPERTSQVQPVPSDLLRRFHHLG